MEISQEVSTVADRTIAGLSAPVFPKTSVETILSVKDGETVAIAGLTRDTNRWIRAGIPFLSDIPYLGALFGGTIRNNSRTELLVLITPHVIRNPDRFQELSDGLRDSLRNVNKLVHEHEADRIRDVEDARLDREKRELDDIREIKQPKQ
jgi:general secretion pathway protein D